MSSLWPPSWGSIARAGSNGSLLVVSECSDTKYKMVLHQLLWLFTEVRKKQLPHYSASTDLRTLCAVLVTWHRIYLQNTYFRRLIKITFWEKFLDHPKRNIAGNLLQDEPALQMTLRLWPICLISHFGKWAGGDRDASISWREEEKIAFQRG